LFSFDKNNNSGMSHPYGIAVSNKHGLLWATMQNTEALIAYNLTTGEPAHLPDGPKQPEFPGEVAHYGKKGSQGNGLRGAKII